MTERVPIEKVIPGFETHPLNEGWVPIEGFFLIKSLDEDGDQRWSLRATEGLRVTEIIGILVQALDSSRKQALSEWDDSDPYYGNDG